MSDTSKSLHVHTRYEHKPVNVNHQHKAERQQDLNSRIAVWLTAYVGTMQTAYGFTALAIVGLFGVLSILNPGIYTLVAWLSQTLIQLVLLPVIMVGQNVLGRHAELQADEMFHNVQRTLNDTDEMIKHLDSQDAELLKQTDLLLKISQEHGNRDDVTALVWHAIAEKLGVGVPKMPVVKPVAKKVPAKKASTKA